jgi:betaine reductase
MDPENQALIKRIVEERGADIVVMLGAADAEAVEVAAETVRDGDPAWVGPLAGVQLGLPVVHVFEDEVKRQADAAVYEQQIGVSIALAQLTLRGRKSHQSFLLSPLY